METYQNKIGCFIHIPNVGRGQLKYVGEVDNKPGIYAGIDLLANIGKNNGSYQGKKYFETEYPQSGLFIQLQKVASLIESTSTNGSRRSTIAPIELPPGSNTDANYIGSRIESVGSTTSTVVRQPHMISLDEKSPTPSRNGINDKNSIIGNSSRSISGTEMLEDHMDIDPPSSADVNDNANKLIREYEIKIDKQQRQLILYKKLLDDQRVVLEELQPTIDGYELNLQNAENEIKKLRDQLNEEKEQRNKQKEFLEAEHEQLLAVVDQLHEEIKENERRVIASKSSPSNNNNTNQTTNTTQSIDYEAMQNELEMLQNYKKETETSKIKWDKEREQLKMHNDSLSKEYQLLTKELFQLQNSQTENNNNDSANDKETILNLQNEISYLKSKIKTDSNIDDEISENAKIIEPPLKNGKNDTESSWCALCEQNGHSSIDCQYNNS
ncbi:hypothetical protein Kpol_2002p41 [Vanderwaltozyma polyspora DSM 70294]|uniref:CAP-Gly domain-containing protein n=1 Tax=Vanderwaltozyma polyspora (strain ATCC 22028 / DSM 70294 / BCRC 21397 / CBS 2163 / NBRC 10782 / NRRL Y-8283 / UCD 57-17) TaxID=436907 RepID=A7TFF7_VANPO|nr:uncharacterized protein Kpol_2002p41 [Vanderwaltozyma polyspora DSM 70294]EDO18971.1 hypothetical protein Kpol_2002p41 [Vanderwaltozyma polyspora DSM 70294]